MPTFWQRTMGPLPLFSSARWTGFAPKIMPTSDRPGRVHHLPLALPALRPLLHRPRGPDGGRRRSLLSAARRRTPTLRRRRPRRLHRAARDPRGAWTRGGSDVQGGPDQVAQDATRCSTRPSRFPRTPLFHRRPRLRLDRVLLQPHLRNQPPHAAQRRRIAALRRRSAARRTIFRRTGPRQLRRNCCRVTSSD